MPLPEPGQQRQASLAVGPTTGKGRAALIPLTYYKRANALERWKLGLGLAALAAALLWGGYLLWGGPSAQMQITRGPVAAIHATWESNCDACHTPFTPINDRTLLSAFPGKTHESDRKCQECHAGPAHHKSQKEESTPSCGSCHRDHRGRDAVLTRLPDGDCTRCHAHLSANLADGARTAFTNTITRFTVDHPNFPSIRRDPGRLKFNHKLHMTPGLVRVEGGKPWTLGDIKDPADQDRYRLGQQKPGDTVRLDCASCHQLDGGDFGLGATAVSAVSAARLTQPWHPPRAAGAYMLPIAYENQCRACHPTSLEPSVAAGEKTVVTVPHGLQPNDVRSFLWGAYARQYVDGKPDLRQKLDAARIQIPGRSSIDRADEAQARKAIEAHVVGAERFLRLDKVADGEALLFRGKTTCGECHEYEAQTDLATLPRIKPTQVPAVWFQHARFNHVAHRAVDCRSCHERAYAAEPNASESHTDVLVPGMDNCLKCHAPPTRADGQPAGGARFDCTECHTYHNGNDGKGWDQGIGAAARNPHRKRDIAGFLSDTAAGQAASPPLP